MNLNTRVIEVHSKLAACLAEIEALGKEADAASPGCGHDYWAKRAAEQITAGGQMLNNFKL